jgi:micrococcal nuclease
MRRRRPSKKGLIALSMAALLLAALLTLLTGPPPSAPNTAGPLPSEGVVSYVYDGDTVEVSGVGKVRIIGIDAMDDYNMERAAEQSRSYGMPLGTVKRWAEEATQFARKTLNHEVVTLDYGPEAHDRYGRVLAYVEMGKDRQDYGLLMIDKGLAAAYGVFNHPRRAQYRRAEEKAQDERVGMWKDATIRP